MPYWTQYRWWLGMLFVVGAALGNFAAFALAPQVSFMPATHDVNACHLRTRPCSRLWHQLVP